MIDNKLSQLRFDRTVDARIIDKIEQLLPLCNDIEKLVNR